jgi:hypothetical protein
VAEGESGVRGKCVYKKKKTNWSGASESNSPRKRKSGEQKIG